jgi:hypothetical protein
LDAIALNPLRAVTETRMKPTESACQRGDSTPRAARLSGLRAAGVLGGVALAARARTLRTADATAPPIRSFR